MRWAEDAAVTVLILAEAYVLWWICWDYLRK